MTKSLLQLTPAFKNGFTIEEYDTFLKTSKKIELTDLENYAFSYNLSYPIVAYTKVGQKWVESSVTKVKDLSNNRRLLFELTPGYVMYGQIDEVFANAIGDGCLSRTKLLKICIDLEDDAEHSCEQEKMLVSKLNEGALAQLQILLIKFKKRVLLNHLAHNKNQNVLPSLKIIVIYHYSSGTGGWVGEDNKTAFEEAMRKKGVQVWYRYYQ